MSDSPTFSPPKSWIKIDLRHSFMIFSILLLGVIFVTSLIVVDYLVHNSGSETFFYCFVQYLQKISLLKNSYILAPLGVLILYGFGLSVHLMSYFYVSVMTMFMGILVPDWITKKDFMKRFNDDKLNVILLGIHDTIAAEERHVQKREFLYLILQRYDTPISSDLKFIFIQLIYARTISFILGINVIIYLYSKQEILAWLFWTMITLILIWIIYIFNVYHFEHMLRISYYAEAYTKKTTSGISNTENSSEVLISVGEEK